MRVLFCQSVPYLPQDQGGALANTHALCLRMQASGHDVSVLAGERRGATSVLNSLRSGGWGKTALAYPVRREHDPLGAAQAICRDRRPDIAVVQLGDIAALCEVFLAADVPTIAYIHDVYSLDSAATSATSTALRYAACSQFVAERISDRFGREATVIPVLIEPELYRTATQRRVVTFVNPIPRKGAEIVFALAARRPDISFELVEAWQLRHRVTKYLEARAAHHGNVRLVRSASDMRPVYSRSRIVIAPSLGDEAWGRVVSEAQINGIPSLASNSGGLPEAVGPGGLIVDRDASMSDWHSALSEMWDNSAQYDRYSERAAAHAARPDFQPDAVADRAMRVFRDHAGQGT